MFYFILINFFRKYSLIESKGCFHINFAFVCNYLYRKMMAYFVLNMLYFHCIYFLWPKVNLYFQWTQSYCKSKRITLKQTFENIFLDIFCVDRWSDGGFSQVDMLLEENRLFVDREQLTLLNSATPLRSPIRNILWSFLTFLACRE